MVYVILLLKMTVYIYYGTFEQYIINFNALVSLRLLKNVYTNHIK